MFPAVTPGQPLGPALSESQVLSFPPGAAQKGLSPPPGDEPEVGWPRLIGFLVGAAFQPSFGDNIPLVLFWKEKWCSNSRAIKISSLLINSETLMKF